jgi:hypothetical protein
MPNWCNNSITIKGCTENIKQLWEEATAKGSGLLNAIAPMPKELEDTTAPSTDGSMTWYSWRVNNWGTKWEVDTEGLEFIDHEDGTAEISGYFDSAWGPPINAFNTLAADFDSCYAEAYYCEPGMGFVGYWNSEGADEYYEYSDATSKTIRDIVPDYLVDWYCLEEDLKSWEEMEEEQD